MTLEIKKVLISDKVDASCQTVLKENNIEVDYKPGLSKDELKAIIKVQHFFLLFSKIALLQ